MKTILTATTFALTLGLTGLAHAAGFNDRSPAIDTHSVRMGYQNLSHLPTVAGFNGQSHHAEAAVNAISHNSYRSTNNYRGTVALGLNCDLDPSPGFQNSTSIASC